MNIGLFKKIQSLEKSHKKVIAPLYVIISVISISFAQALIKYSTLSVSQILYIRSLIICSYNGLSSNQPIYTVNKPGINLKMWNIIYGSSLAIQAVMIFQGMRILSLAEATIIYSTYSVWSQFWAKILLNEQLRNERIRNCFFSMLGVVFVTRPPFIFGGEQKPIENHLYGCLIVLLASLIFSFGITTVKVMGTDVPSESKLQHFHYSNLIINALLIIISGTFPIQVFTFDNISSCLLIAFFSYWCHILQIRAFSLASLAQLSPYMYTNILTSIILDLLMFGIIPHYSAILGTFFIFLSMYLDQKQ